jgi:hypothetical protein
MSRNRQRAIDDTHSTAVYSREFGIAKISGDFSRNQWPIGVSLATLPRYG